MLTHILIPISNHTVLVNLVILYSPYFFKIKMCKKIVLGMAVVENSVDQKVRKVFDCGWEDLPYGAFVALRDFPEDEDEIIDDIKHGEYDTHDWRAEQYLK